MKLLREFCVARWCWRRWCSNRASWAGRPARSRPPADPSSARREGDSWRLSPILRGRRRTGDVRVEHHRRQHKRATKFT